MSTIELVHEIGARRETRTCQCGCGYSFTVNATSRKVYLNRVHVMKAKEQRRQLKSAGVAV